MNDPLSISDTTLPQIVLTPVGRRPLVVNAIGMTDPGLVRHNNEDHFLIAELTRILTVHHTNLSHAKTQFGSPRGHIFVVADGVGGHKGGEQASALSVLTVESFLLNTLKRFFNLETPEEHHVLKEFQNALHEADARIIEEARQPPDQWGMGTTFTMGFAVDGKLFLAHAGDSRCYLLSEGELLQVTQDHTVVAEMVRQGVMTPQQALRSPYRNLVTNVLGGKHLGVKVEVHQLNLLPGDTILLCTDGLTSMVSDERIRFILQGDHTIKSTCARLVAEANQLGGNDNITVVIARFEAHPR